MTPFSVLPFAVSHTRRKTNSLIKRGEDRHNSSSPDSSSSPVELYHSVQQPIPSLRTRGEREGGREGGKEGGREGGREGRREEGGRGRVSEGGREVYRKIRKEGERK